MDIKRRATQPEPFKKLAMADADDTYTMKQAVEEGFILDVLRNYTPVKKFPLSAAAQRAAPPGLSGVLSPACC